MCGLHQGTFTEADEIIRQKFSQIIVNFAKTGDPSGPDYKWTCLNTAVNNYFSIDFDQNLNFIGMKRGYHKQAVTFWNNTVFGYAFDFVTSETSDGDACLCIKKTKQRKQNKHFT